MMKTSSETKEFRLQKIRSSGIRYFGQIGLKNEKFIFFKIKSKNLTKHQGSSSKSVPFWRLDLKLRQCFHYSFICSRNKGSLWLHYDFFLANSYFLLQISLVKSYKLRCIKAMYHNFSLVNPWKELKKKSWIHKFCQFFQFSMFAFFVCRCKLFWQELRNPQFSFKIQGFLIVQTMSTYSWVSNTFKYLLACGEA